VAILNEDLLAPEGPVEKALFPGEDVIKAPATITVLEERLNTYIARAEDKVAEYAFNDEDEAVKNYALYLTFDAAYTLAVSRPASENSLVAVIGSESYSKDQRDALRTKSLEYLAAYNNLVEVVTSVSPELPRGVPTRQTTNSYEY
jgi:hypothetical protein